MVEYTSQPVRIAMIINEPDSPIKGFVTVKVIRTNGDTEIICEGKKNLLLNEGRDQMHTANYTDISDAIATRNPFNFIGLSTNGTTPVATNTRTTWELIEITTGGIVRAQATVRTHVAGTNVSTLQQTFTASSAFTGVQKGCLLDRLATGTGIAAHETLFTSTNLSSGDQLILTWNLVLG